MAVDAPIPNASVTMATSAKPRLFQSVRAAYRISCRSVSMSILSPLGGRFSRTWPANAANDISAHRHRPQQIQPTVHLVTMQVARKFQPRDIAAHSGACED